MLIWQEEKGLRSEHHRSSLQPAPSGLSERSYARPAQGKKISQEGLAAAAGLDRSFISLVERGIQSPNIMILLKMAEVLEISAAELIAKTEAALRTGQRRGPTS